MIAGYAALEPLQTWIPALTLNHVLHPTRRYASSFSRAAVSAGRRA